MKRLIITRADKRVREISEVTHPVIQRYAKKWGADFLILQEDVPSALGWGKIHYRIMKVYGLFDEYDRIINIDTDAIINESCPDLFELVPEDKIGVVFEDRGSRSRNRRSRIFAIQRAWGDIGWTKGYINTGIFVVSKSHREIFQKFKGMRWEKDGYSDVHLGYQINRLGFEIFNLGWRFNHMSMFSEPWNGSPSRFDSHIMHYAGKGSFPDKRGRSKAQLIKDDIKRVYG